jgi:hypothetical protein
VINRARPVIIVLALLAGALSISVSPAAAKDKSCAQKVIDDWYGDGRVDGTYPLHCYRDAIKKLPEDVVVYSSAKEDIERALAKRIRSGGTSTTPTGAGTQTGPTSTTPSTTDPTKTGPTGTDTTTEPRPDPNGPSDDGDPDAIGDTESASSVPLPLIALGGLALLLLTAGGVGYVTRRMHNGRDGGPGEPPPTV